MGAMRRLRDFLDLIRFEHTVFALPFALVAAIFSQRWLNELHGAVGTLGTRESGGGWSYVFSGMDRSYIWPESDYSEHPEWGLPVLHGGKQALRTHSDRHGHTIIYQDVKVRPETKYRASVWVNAVDLRGKGFGKAKGDSAGLLIQEIGADGNVAVSHPKVAVTAACGYRKLEMSFTTGRGTKSVRYVLDTVINCPYDEGHVTYDDCSLEPE